MKPKEELHSFPYEAEINGKLHHYRITVNGPEFVIEQDGLVIAEIVKDKDWRQQTGKPLEKELMESICRHIDAH